MSTKAQPLTGHPPATRLTNEEILRYSRHLIMPEVGMEGRLKLKTARVLLIGTGGLGAPLGLYLTAAGVGHIDVVDFTNLQRQITYGTGHLIPLGERRGECTSWTPRTRSWHIARAASVPPRLSISCARRASARSITCVAESSRGQRRSIRLCRVIRKVFAERIRQIVSWRNL